jgi:glycopeptide antibiotics resistance protein
MPLPRRVRVRAAVALATYAVFVALVVFWPSPVDGPVRGQLSHVLGMFDRVGIRPIDAYTVLETGSNILFFVPAGFLFVLIAGRRRWWLAPLGGLAASSVIEAIQAAFLPGRFASLMDVAANTAGALLGAALAVAVCLRSERRRAPAVQPAP